MRPSWKRLLKPCFGLLIFALAMWLLVRHLEGYRWHDVWQSLRNIPLSTMVSAVGVMVLSLFVISVIDLLGLRWIKRTLPYSKVAFVSFLTNVFGRSLGFPVLTGGGLRYRFYQRWNFSAAQVGHLIAFQYSGFALGFAAMAGLTFVFKPLRLPQAGLNDVDVVRGIGILLLFIVIAYWILSFFRKKPFHFFKREVPMPGSWIAFGQVGLSALKWLLEALLLYILLIAHEPFAFTTFAAIYFAVQTFSIVTHAPGGFGVFEASFMYLMKHHLPVPEIAASLILYRVLFNLLPMAVALPLYLAVEARLQLKRNNKPGVGVSGGSTGSPS